MAERYGVSVAQLCIRYCLELGLLPLPKTVSPAHMRSNAAVDFSAMDLETLKRQ
jgi:diketogulonate reductase-like aldo/keto reductase